MRLIRLLLITSFFIGGLAGGGANAQSSKELRSRVENLERHLLAMQKRINAESNKSPKTSDVGPDQDMRMLYADLNIQLGNLERQISLVTGRLEELEHKQGMAKDDLDLLRKDMELRFSELPKPSTVQPALVAATPNTESVVPAQEDKTKAAAKTTVIDNGISDKEKFDQAFAYVRRGDLENGEKQLQIFLEENPKSPIVANAKFWLGRIYLMRKENTRAARQFLTVVTEHPDSNKVGASMLELTETLINMGEMEEACRTMSDYARIETKPTARVLTRIKRMAEQAKCE